MECDYWRALKRIFADQEIHVKAFLARTRPMAGEVAVSAAFWNPLLGAERRSKKPFGKITLDSARSEIDGISSAQLRHTRCMIIVIRYFHSNEKISEPLYCTVLLEVL